MMSLTDEEQRGELLSGYLEGDLSEADRARVEELLQASEEARKDLDALRRTLRLLGEMEELEPSPSLWERISSRLPGAAPSAGRAGWWRRVRQVAQPAAVTAPLGGAVAAALVLLAVFLYQERGQRFLMAERLGRVEAELSRERALRVRFADEADAEREKWRRTARVLDLRNRESDALSLLVSVQLKTLAETREELDRERRFRTVAKRGELRKSKASPPRLEAASPPPAPPLALEVFFQDVVEVEVLEDIQASGGRPWPAVAEAGRAAIRPSEAGREGRVHFVLPGKRLPELIRRLETLRGVTLRRVPDVPAAAAEPEGRVRVRIELAEPPSR